MKQEECKEKIVENEATDVAVCSTKEVPVVDAVEDGGNGVHVTEGESGEMTMEQVEELVAAAEHRGYLRGRNESIEELMRKPGMLERGDTGRKDAAGVQCDAPEILSRRRVSIWER